MMGYSGATRGGWESCCEAMKSDDHTIPISHIIVIRFWSLRILSRQLGSILHLSVLVLLADPDFCISVIYNASHNHHHGSGTLGKEAHAKNSRPSP